MQVSGSATSGVEAQTAGVKEPGLQLLSCPRCAALQTARVESPFDVVACRRCRTTLERGAGHSLAVSFACASAVLLLLVPANACIFMSTSVVGATLSSHLWSSVTSMWSEGWPWLAIVVAAFVVVLPIVRFGLLSLVLGALLFERRPRNLGRAFRYALALEPWAMPDVFLLGVGIAYARLHATMYVALGPGAECLIAAGILSLVTRASMPVAEIWRRIHQEPPLTTRVFACASCALPVGKDQLGGACPRCGSRVTAFKPGALEQTAALTAAALFLYVLANIYPMATIPLGLEAHSYTVLEGVVDLFKAHLVLLGLLVLVVSFAIPFAKLLGLSWCVASVARGWRNDPRRMTLVHVAIEEVGRWSMTDPFAIACFVPLIRYNSIIYGRAEAGASIFSFVVIATMMAARRFDSRLLWDAATS